MKDCPEKIIVTPMDKIGDSQVALEQLAIGNVGPILEQLPQPRDKKLFPKSFMTPGSCWIAVPGSTKDSFNSCSSAKLFL
jgi:hypothetical protein